MILIFEIKIDDLFTALASALFLWLRIHNALLLDSRRIFRSESYLTSCLTAGSEQISVFFETGDLGPLLLFNVRCVLLNSKPESYAEVPHQIGVNFGDLVEKLFVVPAPGDFVIVS